MLVMEPERVPEFMQHDPAELFRIRRLGVEILKVHRAHELRGELNAVLADQRPIAILVVADADM